MVFIFGMDVPLIEMFAVLTLLLILTVVLLIVSLFKQRKINSTLNEVLQEEREVKEELDLTKLETDKNLILMKKLVKELGQLHLISDKKKGEMNKLISVSQTAQQLNPGDTQEQSRLLQQIIAHVSQVDRTVQHENKQLDYIIRVLQSLMEEEQQTTSGGSQSYNAQAQQPYQHQQY